MTSKTELRKRLRQERLDIPKTEVAAKSERILTQIKQLIDANPAKRLHVHCFEPITVLHEVDVTPLIARLSHHQPPVTLYTLRYIDGWHTVTLDGEVIATNPVYDYIIVPMLGFDTGLRRLGHGGGTYDRFLSGQAAAVKVGVCFELGRVDELPVEPHDIPMDMVITEDRIYHP